MLKPSADSSLKEVPSKYSLVVLVSKRAHKLDGSVQPAVGPFNSVKSVGRALEEIGAGTVISDSNPEERHECLRIECEERKRRREQEQKELENHLRDEKS